MTCYFVSDIHLSEKKPEITQAFFSFLHQHASKAQQFYLAGDIFEYWVDDQISTPLTRQFIDEMQALHNQGVIAGFLPGNRDFLLGQSFLDQANCQLLPDPFSSLPDTSLILSHGDALCTDDRAYMRMRRILRSGCTRSVSRMIPVTVKQVIASRLRKASKNSGARKYQENAGILDVNSDAASRLLEDSGRSVLIHGHTHRPAIHYCGPDRYRVVLGDWSEKGGVIARLCRQQLELMMYQASTQQLEPIGSVALPGSS